jgi:hypothetical protein
VVDGEGKGGHGKGWAMLRKMNNMQSYIPFTAMLGKLAQ